VSKDRILTAVHSSERRGLQLTANSSSSDRCSACPHAILCIVANDMG